MPFCSLLPRNEPSRSRSLANHGIGAERSSAPCQRAAKPFVWFLRCSALVAILVLAGCGPSFNKVSGTVSYKGKKLTMGTITFVGDDSKKTFTTIAGNGFYEAIEPPLGKVKVSIAVKPPPNIPVPKGLEKGATQKIEPVIIPPNYGDANKSGLTTEIKSGSNTYDIDLK